MTTTTELKPGQTVIYHGSLTEAHGEAVFVGLCEPCADCTGLLDTWDEWRSADDVDPPVRYVLALNPFHELRCVRRESFTPVVHFAQTA